MKLTGEVFVIRIAFMPFVSFKAATGHFSDSTLPRRHLP
jgi:hypothetical protein